MAHVIAPQRAVHAAEQAGPCPLRRQQQARRLDASCGHDQGFDGQVRACRSVGNRDRLDLCRVGVEPEIHNRGIQHDADVGAGFQPVIVDMGDIRIGDPAFQRVAADAAIVRPQGRVGEVIPAAQESGRIGIPAGHGLGADRPARILDPGPGLEIDRVERHAAPTPLVGIAAQCAAAAFFQRHMVGGVQRARLAEVVFLLDRPVIAGFQHQDLQPAFDTGMSQPEPDRARPDNAYIGVGKAPEFLECHDHGRTRLQPVMDIARPMPSAGVRRQFIRPVSGLFPGICSGCFSYTAGRRRQLPKSRQKGGFRPLRLLVFSQ